MKMLGLVLVLAAAAGCQETNPNYCKGHPDNNCALGSGSGDGGTMACSGNAQCTDPGAPICDSGAGVCVACTGSDLGACAAMTPICSNEACVACTAHAQCTASDACLPDGSCGTDDNVAYVSPTGSTEGACTFADQCKTISRALSTTNAPFIKVTGTISDNIVIARNVTILADAGATLQSATASTAVVAINGTDPSVEIDDLTITGGLSGTGIGVSVPNGATATLVLQRVTVTGNAGMGVSFAGGVLTMKRSTIYGNNGGGVYVTGASYDLENNIIAANGSPTSSIGGFEVVQDVAAEPHIFDFNTVADNDSTTNNTTGGVGVSCLINAASRQFNNDIVWNNATHQLLKTGADCTFTYSDIGPDGPASSGTMLNADPQLDASYHIPGTSPAKDSADPTANEPVDIVGDSRPIGLHDDMGAFETQ